MAQIILHPDAAEPSEGLVTVGPELELPESFQVQDLLTDATYVWSTGGNYVRLEPGQAHILHVR